MSTSRAMNSIAGALSLVLGTVAGAEAQNVTVTLGTTHQTIRGFGGMTHRVWTGYDLNASDRNLAFGNGNGQLGFTVLRIWISDNESQWALELPTAKDVIARGGIVYATPWNPPASMAETVSRNGLAAVQLRQACVFVVNNGCFVFVAVLLARLFISSEEAREGDDGARGGKLNGVTIGRLCADAHR